MDHILFGFRFRQLMLGQEAVEDRPGHHDARVEIIRRGQSGSHRAISGGCLDGRKKIAAHLRDLCSGCTRIRLDRQQVRPLPNR